jgi:ABC-2 type transport system permease protein
MKHLIRAELLKMRTTRTFWWSAVAALAFVPVSVALAVTGTGTGAGVVNSLDSTAGFRNVLAAASSGGVVVMLIGIMLMAGEYRFNTITSTFLVTPDRRRVLGAKLAAAGVVGLAVAALASVLTLAVALPWLANRHVEIASHGGDIAIVLLGAIAATTIAGVVGVGIGALLTNQTLAITATLLWTLVVEAMAVNFVPDLGRWMPGGAAGAMSGASTYANLLPGWAAALVFTGYGVAFAAAGSRFVLRRDVA